MNCGSQPSERVMFRDDLGHMVPTIPARISGASKERAIERPLLTWENVVALTDAIEPRFSALVWTAAASGLRFGELSGLELRHVDVDRSELRVDQALFYAKGAGARLRPHKTESAHRAVVVPAQITHRFCGHIELFVNDMRPKSLDFTLLRGSPLLNRTFSPYWHRALRDPRPRHRRCDRSKDAATGELSPRRPVVDRAL
jgi:integrase